MKLFLIRAFTSASVTVLFGMPCKLLLIKLELGSCVPYSIGLFACLSTAVFCFSKSKDLPSRLSLLILFSFSVLFALILYAVHPMSKLILIGLYFGYDLIPMGGYIIPGYTLNDVAVLAMNNSGGASNSSSRSGALNNDPYNRTSSNVEHVADQRPDTNYYTYISWSARSLIWNVYVGEPTGFLVNQSNNIPVEDPVRKEIFSKEVQSLITHSDSLKATLSQNREYLRTTIASIGVIEASGDNLRQVESILRLEDRKRKLEEGYQELESFVDRVNRSSYRQAGITITDITKRSITNIIKEAQVVIENNTR